ncbi:hypothetical protein EVAR_9142_1 [Eumeta japonica]|uniref:Uncharacterized protein n=1 Tax=Eumeta variegata TaxID=151549 RepID=A0A4C1TWJ5_EUMVA|nr:hypothetical protein EVAR_9142_1 [Eumeta japonica]
MPVLATPCENGLVITELQRIKVGKFQDQNVKDEVQRKDILKDKLKDAESTYKDAKIKAKERVIRGKTEIKDRYDRRFSDNFRDAVADDNVTATEYMIDDGNKRMDEIMKALKRMEVRKAPGYDKSFVRDAEGWRGYSGKPAVPAP